MWYFLQINLDRTLSILMIKVNQNMKQRQALIQVMCLWDIMTLDTSSKLLSDSKFWDRLLKFNGIPRPHILNRSYTYMCEVIFFYSS
jgi:hypothetical protein